MEHFAPVPVKTFSALMQFVYSGTLSLTATDCFYLFLEFAYYQPLVDADFLMSHIRKRMNSVAPMERGELEAAILNLDKETYARFSQSELKTILPPNIASVQPLSTPVANKLPPGAVATPMTLAGNMGAVVGTNSPRAAAVVLSYLFPFPSPCLSLRLLSSPLSSSSFARSLLSSCSPLPFFLSIGCSSFPHLDLLYSRLWRRSADR